MVELEYEMTYRETIEGPLALPTGSPFGERLCWQVSTATSPRTWPCSPGRAGGGGAGAALPLGHRRCGMGADRTSAAGRREPDRDRRPSGEASAPRDRRCDPLPVDNGCKWRALPADYAPWRTVYGFHARWAACGVLGVICDHLRREIRLATGRPPLASAAIIDSQSIRQPRPLHATHAGTAARKRSTGGRDTS